MCIPTPIFTQSDSKTNRHEVTNQIGKMKKILILLVAHVNDVQHLHRVGGREST
jgi:hypothetical protein